MNYKALNVLVVEDNDFTAMTVRRTLHSLGLENISVAANGLEALEHQAESNVQPDIILVDLRMPKMGGMELLGRLAERGYSGQIIVASGVDEQAMSQVEEILRSSRIRVLGFLPKPLMAAELKELLEDATTKMVCIGSTSWPSYGGAG